MPLNSVQQHIKAILDQLPLPGQNLSLQAFIAPPANGDLNQPQVYIWGGDWQDKRQTAPRKTSAYVVSGASGFRTIKYTVSLYLLYQTLSDAVGVDQAFPLIIDAISNALYSDTMPAWLNDSTTGITSQLVAIGEEIHGQMAPVVALSDDGQVLYDAMVNVTVRESLQS